MEDVPEAPLRRGRGRPPGALNKRGSKARGYADEVTPEITPEINETRSEEEAASSEEAAEEEVQSTELSEPSLELEPIPEPEPEPEPEPIQKRRKVNKPKLPVEFSKPARKPRQSVRAPVRMEPEPLPMTYSEALRRFHEDTMKIRSEERRNHYTSFFQ